MFITCGSQPKTAIKKLPQESKKSMACGNGDRMNGNHAGVPHDIVLYHAVFTLPFPFRTWYDSCIISRENEYVSDI